MPTLGEEMGEEARKIETENERIEMRGKLVCGACEAPEMFEEGLVNSIKEGQDLEEHWWLCTEEVSEEL